MRLWSFNPKYLDTKGLCGLWREALQAQSVLLQGEYKYSEEKGKINTPYWNHPQLTRWKPYKINIFGKYLLEIWKEGKSRGYKFDATKIKDYSGPTPCVEVTTGQMEYEFKHLLKKLNVRDKQKGAKNLLAICDNDDDIRLPIPIRGNLIEPHPLFKVVIGPIEVWEKLNNKI